MCCLLVCLFVPNTNACTRIPMLTFPISVTTEMVFWNLYHLPLVTFTNHLNLCLVKTSFFKGENQPIFCSVLSDPRKSVRLLLTKILLLLFEPEPRNTARSSNTLYQASALRGPICGGLTALCGARGKRLSVRSGLVLVSRPNTFGGQRSSSDSRRN